MSEEEQSLVQSQGNARTKNWVRELQVVTPKELLEFGYVQEVNRRFFHPLGMAMAVSNIGRNYSFDGVWDLRKDPEGLTFGDGVMSEEKFRRVEEEWAKRAKKRLEALGYIVQPAPGEARAVKILNLED